MITRGKKRGAKKANAGSFKKGQSGNPSGKPKLDREFRDRCRKAVDEKVIDAWINEVECMGTNWLKASELLAAYGYGRPTQPVAGPDEGPIPVSLVTYKIPDNGRDR